MLEPARITRAERELRSLCAEVGANDPEAFSELVAIRDRFDSMIREAAEAQRANGYSWTDLGRVLGVTRQSARERYSVR